MAYAVNSVTPGSTGEAVRAIVLREGHGIPYSVGLGAIMVERFGALWYLGASAAWAWLTVELSLPLAALSTRQISDRQGVIRCPRSA
jgi:hypothetical protein